MAGLVITLRNATTYNFVAGANSTAVSLLGGGGGGGTGGALQRGGGGGAGAYANTPNVPTTPGQVYPVRVGSGGLATQAGVSSTFNTNVVVAAAGSQGGNQSGLSNGAAGPGGTVANSVGTNRTAGGNGVAGGDGGQAPDPLGGAANTLGDGGAGGQALSGAGVPGNAGVAVLEYSTGVGQISHVSSFNRLLTLKRNSSDTITHMAIFNRQVLLMRAFIAAIAHISSTRKQIAMFKLAIITHNARARKDIAFGRIADILHTPAVNKAIVLAVKLSGITHVAAFARSVTLRRSFAAVISHISRTRVAMDVRLIPGGAGVINVIKRIVNIIFDD